MNSPSTTIGFLARVCPDKGLHQLAAALALLAADRRLPPMRVLAAGYLDPADRPYLAEIQRQMDDAGLADRFEYVGELDRAGEDRLPPVARSVLPADGLPREQGAFGVRGVGQRRAGRVAGHGAFPEMIADTGGGLLCEPDDPASLAAALKRMILDPDFAAECGRRAQQIVHQRYNAEAMARRMIELYEGLPVSPTLRGRGGY